MQNTLIINQRKSKNFDYFKSFVENALRELKKYGNTYAFTEEQVQAILEVKKCSIEHNGYCYYLIIEKEGKNKIMKELNTRQWRLHDYLINCNKLNSDVYINKKRIVLDLEEYYQPNFEKTDHNNFIFYFEIALKRY